MTNSETRQLLTTLRRIPDDVILSMATREYDMNSCIACVCGWALHEDSLRTVGAVTASAQPIIPQCVDRFGGAEQEWINIFGGAARPYYLPNIETAFTLRVAEAVEDAA